MSLLVRKIDVGIQLGTGDFGEGAPGSSNIVTLKGLRVSASITKAGLPSADRAEIRIWGMTRSLMNQITRLGKPLDTVRDNVITISAGDDAGGVAQVFQGTIFTSYGDFNDPPSASVNITAISGQLAAAKPVAAISFPGAANVAVIMQQIAASMDKGFKNSGVGVILSNAYFPGTALDQMKACAVAADINADANGDFLEIWPKDGNRGASIPLLSPTTGLIGYPAYADRGAAVRALYRPGFLYGGQFQLETSIKPANGLWYIETLSYDLESEIPGGKWFMNIEASRRSTTAHGGA